MAERQTDRGEERALVLRVRGGLGRRLARQAAVRGITREAWLVRAVAASEREFDATAGTQLSALAGDLRSLAELGQRLADEVLAATIEINALERGVLLAQLALVASPTVK